MRQPLTENPADFASEPLYKQVKRLLTESLAGGEWGPNEAIPSESRLAQRFQVSIGTVRKAIDELVAEKILVRRQGRGTFVAAHTQNRFLYHFFHIVREDGTKTFPQAELLEFERIQADADMAAALQVPRGAALWRIRNLLRLEGEPVEVNDLYLSAALFHDLTKQIFAGRPGTIYQLYQDRYGINVIHTSERLRATAAGEAQARLLGLPSGAPVLVIERIAYSYNRAPVELRRSWINTARHVYLNDREKQP